MLKRTGETYTCKEEHKLNQKKQTHTHSYTMNEPKADMKKEERKNDKKNKETLLLLRQFLSEIVAEFVKGVDSLPSDQHVLLEGLIVGRYRFVLLQGKKEIKS